MTSQFIPGADAFPSLRAADRDEGDDYRLHRRFDRMGRLVGDRGMQRLFASHALVIGIGGVGSWAAESLVRSGVGVITLVDFDLVCVTNANRQLHAVKGATGKPKVEVMGARLQAINPRCEVRCERRFYGADTSEALLSVKPDVVIDAIDNLQAKTHLIAACRARGLPLVVSGGASGRADPTQLREADLTAVRGDPFLAATRKLLRRDHGFSPATDKTPWGIPTIHSLRPPRAPSRSPTTRARAFAVSVPRDRMACTPATAAA